MDNPKVSKIYTKFIISLSSCSFPDEMIHRRKRNKRFDSLDSMKRREERGGERRRRKEEGKRNIRKSTSPLFSYSLEEKIRWQRKFRSAKLARLEAWDERSSEEGRRNRARKHVSPFHECLLCLRVSVILSRVSSSPSSTLPPIPFAHSYRPATPTNRARVERTKGKEGK